MAKELGLLNKKENLIDQVNIDLGSKEILKDDKALNEIKKLKDNLESFKSEKSASEKLIEDIDKF